MDLVALYDFCTKNASPISLDLLYKICYISYVMRVVFLFTKSGGLYMDAKIAKWSNFFLFITIISAIFSATQFLEAFNSDTVLITIFMLISIPLIFLGITVTLKLVNRALTTQSISMMKIITNSNPTGKAS